MGLIAKTLLGLAGSVVSVASASAGPLDAATILQNFNAVIYTYASTSSDIDGAAVIGGNFSGGTVYGNPTVTQPSGFGALTVFGTTSSPINLNGGGNAYVAGQGVPVNFNGGGGYIGAPGSTITDFETPLNAFSQSLSTLAATAPTPATGNNEVFSAVAGTNGVAVFDLTAAALAAIPSFSVALNGASAVVFNVDGNNVNYGANDASGSNGASNILWNFYDAANVGLNTLIGGTVLATGAAVSVNQVDGVLVANSWTGNGALHDQQFTSSIAVAVPVPEPASLALLGIGLVGLGVVRRRAR